MARLRTRHTKTLGLQFLVVLVLAGAPTARSQTVLYVDTNADQQPHDMSHWCQAYRTLDEALAVAEAGTIIRVADGTYIPSVRFDPRMPRSETFQLVSGVTLEGGYAGCGDGGDRRDIESYETILSGDLNGDDVPRYFPDGRTYADNCYHVFYHPGGLGLDETAVIDGFTITGGNANAEASSPHTKGGGMYNAQCYPTVARCKFKYNSAARSGAGLYGEDGSPTITGCRFTSNAAVVFGGGLYCKTHEEWTLRDCVFDSNSARIGGGAYVSHGSATIEDCTFESNSANYGGGVRVVSSSPTLDQCRFLNNWAANDGGGLYNITYSHPTITDCEFARNSAGRMGGGMYNGVRCHPHVERCDFADNSARWGGGMFNKNLSEALVTGCSFRGNSAEFSGGGMENSGDCEPIVIDCLFAGNAADAGGAMHNTRSNPTLIDCIVSGNTARLGGGLKNGNGSSPILVNCFFTGNRADGEGGATCDFSSTPTMINCALVANSAGMYGGGMYCAWDSAATVSNCTFVANAAGDDGGGIYNQSNSGATVANSIFWANTAPDGPQLKDADGAALLVTHSCVQGADLWPGVGNIRAYPQFVRDPNPGEDALWGTEDDDYGDLRIRAGSEAIDAGNTTAVPPDTFDLDDDGDTNEPTPLDLGGGPRFVDDPQAPNGGPGGLWFVDMGAYEYRLMAD